MTENLESKVTEEVTDAGTEESAGFYSELSDSEIAEINELGLEAEDVDEEESEGGKAEEPEPKGTDAGAETAGKDAEGETTPKPDTATEPELFELKHLDKTYRKTREEMVPLAQKGLDYDRIREKYESASAALKEFENWVREITNGQDVKTFRETVDARRLAEKEGIEYETALAKVRIENEKADLAREREKLEALRADEKAAQERAEKQQRDIENFIKAYPDVAANLDKDPDAIPADVWALVKNGESLVSAYAVYEARASAKAKEEELTKIKKELEEERLARKNGERSTGSLSTSGGTEDYDPIRAGWESV